MGWPIRRGVAVRTDGPVPDAGTVDIVTTLYVDGRPFPLQCEPFPADRFATWRGYSLDMHGLMPLAEPPRGPIWSAFEDDGTLRYTLELDRIRVQADGSDLYAELIVTPAVPGADRGIRLGIFGWDSQMPPRVPPADEISKAVRGLELLGAVRELEAARVRRRPRLEELEDAGAERGWLTLTECAIELHQKHGVDWKVAADRIGVSNKTLKRWRARRTKLLGL